MLWSLLKVILFLALVAAGAWGAGLLMEMNGGVRVSFANLEVTLGPLQTVIALILLVIALWLLIKIAGLIVAIVRFASGDETAISRYFARNRERKGFEALAESMMALASGEGRLALSKAARADRFLNRPELTTLLTAQAAEMTGDQKKAEAAYKALLASDRTRFVGIRGIMKQKLAEGDTDMAMKLAEKAFALKPKHEETQDLLLKLQAGAHDWSAARRTLGAKLKHGSLPRDVHKRRDAVLALGEAKDILDETNPIEAREAAIEANRLSPDLIPAAVMAADAFTEEGKKRQATRLLKKAWEASPHPDLAASFARIEPDETPAERIKRFRTLTSLHADNPETRMLEAELLIAAEDFPGARKALGDLAETDPTARSLTIMAAIERGSGADDAIVKGWLARALTAPRGPQWVCDSCQKIHAHWGPVCDNCGGFDTLSWRRPDDDGGSMPAGAEMLPLIVGHVHRTAEPEPDEDAIEGEVAADAENLALDETVGSGGDSAATEVDETPSEETRRTTANADAPPPDYVIDGDDDEATTRTKKT